MSIIYGYACISALYSEIRTGGGSTLTYINKLPFERRGDYLRIKVRENLKALPQLLRKNALNGIGAYRLPDNLLPMADLGYYDISEFYPLLRECGEVANMYNIYLSFHPSQFFVLNSATPSTVDSAIKNLNIFATILEAMQLRNHPTLLVHVGARSTYPTQKAACDAFCANYNRLSPAAQRYLAVENDQSAHSIDSCVYINDAIGIPVVCDNAHYNKKSIQGISLRDSIQFALSTWGKRMPKLHISSEREPHGKHSHADYILAQDLESVLHGIGNAKCIVMVEAKMKDRAVQKILRGDSQ